MGACKSRIRGIPVYISLNGPHLQPRVGGSDSERGFALRGRIVETHELFPLKVIKPKFNDQYQLHFVRYAPPHIHVRYPGMIRDNGQVRFNSGMQIDRENTFKEGSHLQITFRPRQGPQPSSNWDSFEWYPDLTCIIIKLIL